MPTCEENTMRNRWSVLALLFCIRATMALQFEAVAALSPFVQDGFGIGLADIGLLIGLYLSPGIVIAIPGAAIGRRIGDKRTVVLGLVLMLAGAVVVALVPLWQAQLAGRVIAGIGGVVLSVLTAKMVTGWFEGKQLATAMGIYVNSWPVGIAAGLLVLPWLAASFGLSAAMWVIAALIAVGLMLLLVLYHEPAETGTALRSGSSDLGGQALAGVLIAGAIWGLYNSALAVVFSFGPAMLAERGWSPESASSTTSIVLWLVALSVPLGGYVADRLPRKDTFLAAAFLAFAVLMLLAPSAPYTAAVFASLGLVGGLAAGPIMSLPAAFLSPGTRARGMGLFFAVYYVSIFATPVIAGHVSEATGNTAAAFVFGAGLLVACPLALALLRALAHGAPNVAVGQP
jgi:MFS family permease